MNRSLPCAFALLLAGGGVASAASDYTITDLGTLGGPVSAATAISATGQVVGVSLDGSGNARAFTTGNDTLLDLGTLGGPTSYASDVNLAGDIVGDSLLKGRFYKKTRAFLFRGDTISDLNTLIAPGSGWTLTNAFGLNDDGRIVGGGTDASGNQRAFVLEPLASIPEAPNPAAFELQPLGTLGGPTSVATDINSEGTIVGYSQIAPKFSWTIGGPQWGDARSTPIRAFIYQDGEMTSLGTLDDDAEATGRRHFAPASYSYAAAINEQGWVVGTSSLSGTERAFLYADGEMIDLGTLPLGSDIEAIGPLPGVDIDPITTFENTAPRPKAAKSRAARHRDQDDAEFAWEDDEYEISDCWFLPPLNSHASAINASGQVVGDADYLASWDAVPEPHAVLYDTDGILYDLNELIPADSGWTLNSALGISDDGRIVGYGTASDGETRAFLLTPIPAPVVIVTTTTPTATGSDLFLIKGITRGKVSKVTWKSAGKTRAQSAIGTRRWQFRAKLKPGRNVITVQAQGNRAKSQPKKVIIVRR